MSKSYNLKAVVTNATVKQTYKNPSTWHGWLTGHKSKSDNRKTEPGGVQGSTTKWLSGCVMQATVREE